MYTRTIKKEKDLFKKDLSNKDGSYAKCLNDNIFIINEMGVDAKIDLNNYINKIIEIIKPAHDTNAKRNFIVNLQRQRSKINAMMYVNNAWLKGSGLEAI